MRGQNERQYDRLISQFRIETGEWYGLSKFFLGIESATLGAAFFDDIQFGMLHIGGIVISVLWIVLLWKQKLWLDYWMSKVKCMENQMNLEECRRLFPCSRKSTAKWYAIGRGNMMEVSFALPIMFGWAWIWRLSKLPNIEILRDNAIPAILVFTIIVILWMTFAGHCNNEESNRNKLCKK